MPSHIANLWTTYSFEIAGLKGFAAGGGVNYRGRIYGNQLNTARIPSYVTSNVELSFKAKIWDVSVGVKNIADSTYFLAVDGAGALVGDPRALYMQGNIHY